MAENNHEVAVFAGGCFWCTEAVFSQLKGVLMVVPGYAGGHTENPTYREVCTDSTGHSEAVRIQFDSDQIPYQRLLEVFFETHDPTTLNRQGADRGTHYRSMVLYAGDAQKEQAEAYIKELDSSGSLRDPIVTEVVPFEAFYPAEDYHQGYYRANGGQPYCSVIISPKVAKLRAKFAHKLKA